MAQLEPAGARSMVWMMNSVEPTRSASATTSIMHSGMNQDLDSRKLASELRHVSRFEHLVDRAVALPEQDLDAVDVPPSVLPPRFRRGSQTIICSSGIPMVRAVFRPRCWSGKKRARRRLVEGPIEDGPRIRAGADDTAVPAAERLQVRGRIDVGHRHQVVGVDDLTEVGPGRLDRVQVGHVGHAAAGGKVGQEDLRPRRGQDIRGLRHEVDTAEDDGPAVLALGRKLAELEAVPTKIGEPDRPRPADSGVPGSAETLPVLT